MIAVEKVATWIPVTQEMLDDAEPMRRVLRNYIEYGAALMDRRLVDGADILTDAERVTGWRPFTDSTGYTLNHRVGWRAEMRQALCEFASDAWPEDFVDDD